MPFRLYQLFRRLATVTPAQAHNGHGDVPVGGASRFHVPQGLSNAKLKVPLALDVLSMF